MTNPSAIFKFIKKTKSKYKNIILINHEPSCKNLVLKLIKKKYIKFKKQTFDTSSIAKINFDVNKWNRIKNYSGKLIFLKTQIINYESKEYPEDLTVRIKSAFLFRLIAFLSLLI